LKSIKGKSLFFFQRKVFVLSEYKFYLFLKVLTVIVNIIG